MHTGTWSAIITAALLLLSTTGIADEPLVDQVLDEVENQWPIQQDDAGSGQDAPDEPVPEVWIEPGVIYEGTLGVGHSPLINDTSDYYAFWGNEGDVVDAKARGVIGCYEITQADGQRLAGSCTLAGWDAAYPQQRPDPIMTGGPFEPVTLATTGIHYFHYYYIVPQHYSFSIGINEEAPEPGYLGQPLPPPPPVVPACEDLLSQHVCQAPPQSQEVCRSILSDALCDEIPPVPRP
jgi:hypothetical protein